MSARRHRSVGIETRVKLRPGSLWVSAYEDHRVGGEGLEAVDRAIQEAERYLRRLVSLKRHIARHGIGKESPREHTPCFTVQQIADAWGQALAKQPNPFESTAMFHELRRAR